MLYNKQVRGSHSKTELQINYENPWEASSEEPINDPSEQQQNYLYIHTHSTGFIIGKDLLKHEVIDHVG